MSVTIQPLTLKNVRAVVRLNVTADQAGYVASNADSIAEAYVVPSMQPRAIYAGDDLVGFAMYGFGPDESPETIQGRWWIIRLMIDERFQQRGYGKAAVLELVQIMRQNANCDRIFLGVDPANHGAIRLYESLGFQNTGEVDFGETIMCLNVR